MAIGRPCHWETLPAFRESYPNVDVAETTYVLDRGRMTASGGANALDMMLDWLAAIEGEALAAKVADTLVHTRHLNHPGEARIPAGSRYRVSEPRVLAAIRLMEEHIEDVLTMTRYRRRGGRVGAASRTAVSRASERHAQDVLQPA